MDTDEMISTMVLMKPGGAAPPGQHGDLAGPGIKAVLDQFLDHGSRALHHLTGCHLAGQHIGEDLDFSHA